jgi:putative ABC transport system permease protein
LKAINRKLLRDLWHLRGQLLAIVLVIVSGVSTLIMSLTTLDSLRSTQSSFYAESRFGDVFVSLKRAPESLRERLLEVPGVERVETRVVASVVLSIDGFSDPVTGHLVSIPDGREPLVNRLYLTAGRYPEPGRDDEVVASQPFAEAHGFRPGDTLQATINGRRRTLTIVGTALSAEFLYQIRPGSFIPDFERFGILWMPRIPLASAYDMEEAFNDAVLTLARGASEGEVIDRLDRLLEPYGGLGAIGREDQLSHRFLSEEFRQLGSMAFLFPTIFLSVAAFLLNVVVSRLIGTQREEIAALKAFGYADLAVGWHYAKLILLIAFAGVAGGLLGGIWLGKGLGGLYMGFYSFPYLNFVLRPGVVATAVLVSVGAALAGTTHAVRRAARLPPAEAIRPEPPARYREALVERLGAGRFLSQPSRMILRNLERRPFKSLLSLVGIAFAGSILMVGSFQSDSFDFIVRVQFGFSEREDLGVTLVEPASRRALEELQSLEGVESVEGLRSVPVRLRFENRSYRTSITGLAPGATLHRTLDADLEPLSLPPEGVVLSDHLGREILGARPGDTVTVEVLEGKRPVLRLPVAALVSQFIGVAAYMDEEALGHLLGEGGAVSGAYLAVDSRFREAVYRELEEMPRVAGTVVQQRAMDSFYETMAETVLVFTFINTVLAATIAFGVVYNSARIALSERSRELASLRVLGFTRGEISYILLGELAVLTLAALPVSFIIGRFLCDVIVKNMENDLYRFPLVLEPKTYAFAASVVLVAAVISGLVVRRKLDRLDLVAVLKMRE